MVARTHGEAISLFGSKLNSARFCPLSGLEYGTVYKEEGQPDRLVERALACHGNKAQGNGGCREAHHCAKFLMGREGTFRGAEIDHDHCFGKSNLCIIGMKKQMATNPGMSERDASKLVSSANAWDRGECVVIAHAADADAATLCLFSDQARIDAECEDTVQQQGALDKGPEQRDERRAADRMQKMEAARDDEGYEGPLEWAAYSDWREEHPRQQAMGPSDEEVERRVASAAAAAKEEAEAAARAEAEVVAADRAAAEKRTAEKAAKEKAVLEEKARKADDRARAAARRRSAADAPRRANVQGLAAADVEAMEVEAAELEEGAAEEGVDPAPAVALPSGASFFGAMAVAQVAAEETVADEEGGTLPEPADEVPAQPVEELGIMAGSRRGGRQAARPRSDRSAGRRASAAAAAALEAEEEEEDPANEAPADEADEAFEPEGVGLVDDDYEEEEAPEPPAKKSRKKKKGAHTDKEKTRSEQKATNAGNYRGRQLGNCDYATSCCTRARACYPGTLTRNPNGKRARDQVIPHPEHDDFKAFEEKWQLTNTAEGVYDQLATLVEVGKTNTDRLRAVIVEHVLGGKAEDLDDWLTGHGFVNAFTLQAGEEDDDE